MGEKVVAKINQTIKDGATSEIKKSIASMETRQAAGFALDNSGKRITHKGIEKKAAYAVKKEIEKQVNFNIKAADALGKLDPVNTMISNQVKNKLDEVASEFK